MRRRYDFDQHPSPANTVDMKKPKEILEWLCSEYDQFWKPDRTVNVYALHQAMLRWHKEKRDGDHIKSKEKDHTKIPSQSTLARLYGGASDEFKTSTATALSDFFGVPVSMIRGEVLWSPKEDWGMDLTYREVTLLHQLRQLQPEQRRAISKLIEEMLPEDAERAPVMLTQQRRGPILSSPPKPDKH